MLIDFVRNSDLVDDEWCASFVAAFQRAADAHFTSVYAVTLDCRLILEGDKFRDGAAQIWWNDRSPEPTDLGFHTSDGAPKGYVWLEDCAKANIDPSVTTSHEGWETIADPQAAKTVVINGVEYIFEVADACQDDQFAFLVEGLNGRMHPISAFVYPSYFDENGQAPFVYPPTVPITRPLQIASGGYLGERVYPNGSWTQNMAAEAGPRQIKQWTSRTLRRFNEPT